jgi:hypothetical protein
VLFLEFRYLMYDHRDVRYILAALAIGAVALAWILEAVKQRLLGFSLRAAALLGVLQAAAGRAHLRGWQAGALILCLVMGAALVTLNLGRRPDTLTAGTVGGRRESGPAPAHSRDRRAGRCWAIACAAIAAMAATAWGLGSLVGRYQAAKLAIQPAALTLERAAGSTGARIAYVGANQPYLFFGSRLQNDVRIVPTNDDLAAQFYTFAGNARFRFNGGSPQQWRRNLAALGIRFVVAARSAAEGPERAWMASDPGHFRPIGRTPEAEVWKFESSAPGH